MAKKKDGIRTVRLEDLTIAEILHYMNHNFCEAKFEYMKFGKDFRAAYDLMVENGDFDTVADALGMGTNVPTTVLSLVKVAEPLLKKGSVEDFKQALQQAWENEDICDSWFKNIEMSKEAIEKQYLDFLESLENRLEHQMKSHPNWGVRLVRTKKEKDDGKGK